MGGVYVSLSGKDQSVLLDIVRRIYPDVRVLYVNTGLEYPEVQKLARKKGADIVYPEKSFRQVLTQYGYPVISKSVAHAIYYARRTSGGKEPERVRQKLLGTMKSKDGVNPSIFNAKKWLPAATELPFMISHLCCNEMKKKPAQKYGTQTKNKPYIATMATESAIRKTAWIRHGCNAFDQKHVTSQPMQFWTEQDVLRYILEYNVEIPSVYGDIVQDGDKPQFGCSECKLKCTGADRTGCVYCGFGFHLEKGESRFQRLARTHPRQYEYCMGGGMWIDNPAYNQFLPKYSGDWKHWNPKKIWVPSDEGLGMKFVFDQFNQLYGKEMMRYE